MTQRSFRKETDRRSTTPHEFELTIRSARPQSALPLFSKTTATCFMALGQPADMSKEACFYADADWLSSSITQKLAKGQSAQYSDTANRVSKPESKQLWNIRQTFSLPSGFSFQQGDLSPVLFIKNIDFSVQEVFHANLSKEVCSRKSRTGTASPSLGRNRDKSRRRKYVNTIPPPSLSSIPSSPVPSTELVVLALSPILSNLVLITELRSTSAALYLDRSGSQHTTVGATRIYLLWNDWQVMVVTRKPLELGVDDGYIAGFVLHRMD